MDVTLGMLVDRMTEYNPSMPRPEFLDMSFSSLRLFPQSSKELRTSAIYITDDYRLESTTETLRQYDGDPKQLCVVYVRRPESPDLAASCVDFNTEAEMSTIMNAMQETLDMIHSWEDSLNMEIIRSSDVQTILELSRPIFHFPLALYDPSMKLLAITPEKSEDLIFRELAENGVLTEGTIRRLAELAYFPPEHRAKPTTIRPPDELSPFNKAFFRAEMNGRLRAVLYAPIPEDALTSTALFLLSFLTEKLGLALASTTTLEMTTRLEYEYLIQDLLANKEVSEQSIRARAKYLNIPTDSHFLLLSIDMPENDSIPPEYLLRLLASIHKTALPTLYQDKILILISFVDRDKAGEQFEAALRELRPILKSNQIACGVSMPFFNLLNLSIALLQAENAVKIGRRVIASPFAAEFSLPSTKADPYVFRFEDFAAHYAHMLAAETMDYRDLCAPQLIELVDFARKAKTNHVLILFTYLLCNCRLTDTAAMLFMHRNNIVYHIRRLEEMMRMDFNQFETRLRLMESFEVLLLCDPGTSLKP